MTHWISQNHARWLTELTRAENPKPDERVPGRVVVLADGTRWALPAATTLSEAQASAARWDEFFRGKLK